MSVFPPFRADHVGSLLRPPTLQATRANAKAGAVAAAELRAVVDPANPNPLDPTYSQIYYRGAGTEFDATSLIRGGELGGLIEARDGVLAGAIRDLDAFALPPVFGWLRREARLGRDEMLRTFNCGIGMILIVGPSDVERVLAHLGDEAKIIGAISERGRAAAVRYKGELARGET